MNTEPNREKEIFERALDLPSPAARRGFLDGACGNDAALRARVEALLQAHDLGPEFLPTDPGVTVASTPLSEGPGTKIGRYKLLQQIGQGGMGVVYMAEQEEPVRRRVALKIIKLGMDRVPLALFHYRMGHLREALQLVEEDLVQSVQRSASRVSPRRALVFFLRSGIEKRMGNVDAARQSYSQGLQLHSPALRRPGTPYSGESWDTACEAELLRREAASLLGDATPTAP